MNEIPGATPLKVLVDETAATTLAGAPDAAALPVEVTRPLAHGDLVAVGDVHLLERDGEVVAYLHLDRQVPGRIYVAGLAVRPDLQGGGLGALIMDHFIGSLEPERSTTAVVTVTSARNHFMLSLLLTRGFAGRWLLRDFFGPGRHRFGCQVRTTSTPPAGPLHRAPADRLEEVYRLMEERQHVIRSLVQSDAGPQFLLSPAEPGEFLDCLPPG